MKSDRGTIEAIRAALADPAHVAEALGLERSRTERYKWRCPRHGGTSLSLRRGRDGTLQARCFGCDLAGDVFTLVAEAEGLDARRAFRRVLARAGELAGIHVDATRTERPAYRGPVRIARAAPPGPERTYPALDEVADLWERGIAPDDDAEARAMLAQRGLAVGPDLARVLPLDAMLPPWACFGGRPWTSTGHRLIVPVYDAAGTMRSVRAWRVCEGGSPKRLPPTGHKAAGLVLACEFAVAMFRGTFAPRRVLIVEGEPDFLTRATKRTEGGVVARIGVGAGWWTAAHAARVPDGATVIVRTHRDPAGDHYAAEVARTLAGRCTIVRPTARVQGAA